MCESERVLGRGEFQSVLGWEVEGHMVLLKAKSFSQGILAQEVGLPPWGLHQPWERPHHRGDTHLHNAVPVVTSGDSEEGQEGHAKVPKGGMPAQALTGVRLITL